MKICSLKSSKAIGFFGSSSTKSFADTLDSYEHKFIMTILAEALPQKGTKGAPIAGSGDKRINCKRGGPQEIKK
jgi:hypothetical protein